MIIEGLRKTLRAWMSRIKYFGGVCKVCDLECFGGMGFRVSDYG